MSAPTCEPPPEHREHEWHWLRRGEQWLVVRWLSVPGKLDLWSCGNVMDEDLYRLGFRYVGPAIPPQEPAASDQGRG